MSPLDRFRYWVAISISLLLPSCAALRGQDAAVSPATAADSCWAEEDGDPDMGSAVQAPRRVSRDLSRIAGAAQQEAVGHAAAASIAENCPSGAPHKTGPFGDTVLVGREGYALEHSDELKIPIWVCEHLEPTELTGGAAREGSWFAPDPELSQGRRAELADYLGSGFDRGHLAPAADFKFSEPLMKESFLLSNMSPQVGAGFNRAVWSWLEAWVRQTALDYGGAWAITGGIFETPDSISVIGTNEVGVPTHFFKVVVVSDETGTDAVGFLFENRRYRAAETSGGFQRFVVPIDEIETKSGLDFLRELPSNVETPLERATPDLSTW